MTSEISPGGPSPDPSKRYVRIGASLTITYVALMLLYVVVVWPNILGMKPDEFATFLAGVFSPLAFLWLVIGFLQQGQELRQSSKALWLQGEELRNSVEQQRNLVDVSREQLEFERERINAELSSAKRRAQPDFVFTGGGYSTAGDITLMSFKILNRGNKCTDVRIYVSDERIIRHSLVESGVDFEFNLEVGPDHPLGDRSFKINYIDLLGEPSECILVLVAFMSGSRLLLKIPD